MLLVMWDIGYLVHAFRQCADIWLGLFCYVFKLCWKKFLTLAPGNIYTKLFWIIIYSLGVNVINTFRWTYILFSLHYNVSCYVCKLYTTLTLGFMVLKHFWVIIYDLCINVINSFIANTNSLGYWPPCACLHTVCRCSCYLIFHVVESYNCKLILASLIWANCHQNLSF
jgi:hypothetical protein